VLRALIIRNLVICMSFVINKSLFILRDEWLNVKTLFLQGLYDILSFYLFFMPIFWTTIIRCLFLYNFIMVSMSAFLGCKCCTRKSTSKKKYWYKYKMNEKSKKHSNYFLVATSQVRTSSSIKSSFSFHSDERAFVPQQERWFLRSSRFALCNNPIDAFIWWATSAQYTSSSIIFWTLASVPIAFLILSCILSFEIIILKIILKNPMISVYLIYFLAKVPPASAGFYVQFSCSMFHHHKNKSCKYMECMCIYS